eukprot:9951444-Alexandrium_andersonii.AAC.1
MPVMPSTPLLHTASAISSAGRAQAARAVWALSYWPSAFARFTASHRQPHGGFDSQAFASQAQGSLGLPCWLPLAARPHTHTHAWM